jgi:alpha-glucuronidase
MPWEAASGSQAVQLPSEQEVGEVQFKFTGRPGWYELRLQHFDEEDGVSRFQCYLNEQKLDEWLADQHVPTPTKHPDAHSSTRRSIATVALGPADVIRIVGRSDGEERAGIDYLEIVPIAGK